jgi:hypothetical protein
MNKLALVTLAAALAAPVAWAATDFAGNAPTGAHYRNNSGEPVCTITDLTVSCTGTQIAGVGNNDADLALAVSYAATIRCRNHGGQIVDVKTQAKTSTPLPDTLTEVRNGTLVVSAFSTSSTSVPTDQTFKDLATCPNLNWTKELLGPIVITSATYTLTFQGYTVPAIVVTATP